MTTKPKLKLTPLAPERKLLPLSKIKCQKIDAGILQINLIVNRYACYDFEYPAGDGRTESKLLFILYAPDTCDSKEKFVYATTKDEVKKKVQPFNKEMQVNDWADLDEEAFLKRIK